MTREPRQRHPFDLKLRAAKMVVQQGYEQRVVCAAFDIPATCLSNWVAAFRAGKLKPPRKAKPVERKNKQARALETVTKRWVEFYR